MPHKPPRLILGTALLFWGAMTGRPLLALLLALVVEGSHWTRTRWDFDDTACSRTWRITFAAIILAAVLIWLDGNRYTALPVLLSWMPALLVPMQFVQSYGMRDALPASEFSFLAARRRERDQRLGIVSGNAVFNFGNVTFTTALIAASVGTHASSWVFLPGVVLLTAWMLMSAGKCRPLLLVPLMLLSGLLAHGGKLAIEKAEEWLGHAGERGSSGFNPNFTGTFIGRSGTVQLSPEIAWRLWTAPGSPPPRLLRTATFNTYLGTNWQNQRVESIDFRDLDTRLIDDTPYYLLAPAIDEKSIAGRPSFRIRGTVDAESPLPLPGDALAMRDFELDGIECNSLGTVRVFPKRPVIEGTVLWQGAGEHEGPPLDHEDLRIPLAEKETIRETLVSIGVGGDLPLADKLSRLRGFFHQEFRYSRSPGIRQPAYRITGPTAIGRFLTASRAGHCEYFATAAVLMLRDSGVPARYATGYAVTERDLKRGGHVIRGSHGHAWCRVWDAEAGKWIDFDPTPPGWLGMVGTELTARQRFSDAVKRLREDFSLWRNRPENRLAMTLVMTAIGLGGAGWVFRRLWRSRRQLDQAVGALRTTGIIRTPLHALEKAALRHLGQRPPGLPFAAWLLRLRDRLPNAAILDEAIALHQRLRFDPTPGAPDLSHRLATLARDLEQAMGRIGGETGATCNRVAVQMKGN